MRLGALPVLPPQCVEPVRLLGPCPGEDGKSPGRTSPCGQSRYVLDLPHIGRSPARASAAADERGGALRLKRPACAGGRLNLEVDRRGQEDLARIAVVARQK